MAEEVAFDIRYSQLEDGPFLQKWLEDPKTNYWFPMSTPEEISGSVKNWIGFSRFRTSLTATVQQTPVAIGTLFLLPYRKVSHQCSFYLIVAPGSRKKGIGTSMMKNLINLAKNYFRFESIYVEIFEGSPLLPILNQFHFAPIAHHKKYAKIEGQYLSRITLELML